MFPWVLKIWAKRFTSSACKILKIWNGNPTRKRIVLFERHFNLSPGSPGTHVVGPWVPDSIKLYRDLRTGTQYIGNWASSVIVNGT